MTNSIIVRRAKVKHASAIVRLGKATFEEAFGHLFRGYEETLENYLRQTFALHKIARSLQNPNNRYWLASIAEKPIGYAKLKLCSSHPLCEGRHTGQLQKIYVDSVQIGGGVGKSLLEIVDDEARQQSCEKLWLSVHERNSRALRFYERTGWRDVGPDKFVIGELQLSYRIMVRDLKN